MKGKVLKVKRGKVLLFCAVAVFAAVSFCTASFADEVVRVGIVKFDAKADGVSSMQAALITDELTRMLANSRSISVLERERLEALAVEHRLNLSGLVDARTAVEIGRIAGLQYIVTGAVTHFDTNEKVQSFLGMTSEKKEDAEITIDARLINVQTGEVVFAVSETGKSSNASSTFILGKIAGGGTQQGKNLKETAIADAVSRLGHRINEAVTGEYPQVLSSGGSDIILSLGATSGVKVGHLYKISSEGAEIRDMSGNVIGRRTTPIAVVKVAEVQNNFSVAHVVDKGGNASMIHRGDRIEPISQKEANDMVKKKAFPKSRPRKPISDSGLGGDNLDDRLENMSSGQGTSVTENTPPSVGASFAASNAPSRPVVSTKGLKLENHSTSAAKVIASYGISDDEKRGLIERHKRAEKMLSRDEKFSRYTEMFAENPSDYFAAYQAGKTAFEAGHYSDAKEWAERSLSVNPKYSPAKKLQKSAATKQ